MAGGLLAAALVPSSAEAQNAEACWLRGSTAEEAAQRPSPLGVVAIPMHGEEATLCYGRPSANDRVVMGELVPFGQPWRMGANEATAIHLPFDAEIGGRDGISVKAGSYSLIAIPGAEEWQIVINSSAERWGLPINDDVRMNDVGSFSRAAETTDEMVETLTFRWEPHGEMMGHLVMEWEHTRVEIPVHMAGMEM